VGYLTRCHNDVVIVQSELLAAVDRAFVDTGRGLARWPDPHADRSPRDDEYSRLLDPAKWRIIGARADAWLRALVDAGLADVERGASTRWQVEPGPVISHTDRALPAVRAALPLVVARSQLGDVVDAGVVLGAGDPALCVTWLPDCGCDACDSGSQNELDCLDAHVLSIVSGTFRRLSDGARTITDRGQDGWSASGQFARGEVCAILADPKGWDVVTGASWFAHTARSSARS
jgi:hypothetical protein